MVEKVDVLREAFSNLVGFPPQKIVWDGSELIAVHNIIDDKIVNIHMFIVSSYVPEVEFYFEQGEVSIKEMVVKYKNLKFRLSIVTTLVE